MTTKHVLFLMILLGGHSAQARASSSCVLQRGATPTEIRVVVGLPSQVETEFQSRTKTGLTVILAHRVDVTPNGRGNNDSGHVVVFGCRTFFDPWDEIYHVAPYPDAIPGAESSMVLVKSLSPLPELCRMTRANLHIEGGIAVAVTTTLDPVGPEQLQRTRDWLARHGIGKDSSGMFGRTLSAMLDLKGQTSMHQACVVRKD